MLAHGEDLMLVGYSLEAGAEGAPHSHEETTQASFAVEGRLELRGDRPATVTAGDSYVVPPGTVHGVRATEPTVVLDAFAPPLPAYLPE